MKTPHKIVLAAVLILSLAVLFLVLAAKVDRVGYGVTIGAAVGNVDLAPKTGNLIRSKDNPGIREMMQDQTPWWKSTPRCLKCGDARKLLPHRELVPPVRQNGV